MKVIALLGRVKLTRRRQWHLFLSALSYKFEYDSISHSSKLNIFTKNSKFAHPYLRSPMWTIIEGFQHLTKSEIDALVEAPVLITILVGMADGELDTEERTWSERLLRSRTYNKPKELNEFYRVVVEGFWARMQSEITHLPKDTKARNRELSDRLSKLNPILAKLDIELAADLYKGFLGLAEETAKASGGFLRIGGVSAAEKKWMELPMLTPVVGPKKPRDEEDEEEKDEW
jgi:hypothetical protein